MNIVTIDFEFCNAPGTVTVGHNNDILIQTNQMIMPMSFKIDHCESNNSFWIKTDADLVINWVTMFDIGKDKLVYQGFCNNTSSARCQTQLVTAGSTWEICYTSPVFSWLHQTLNHGWLIHPD